MDFESLDDAGASSSSISATPPPMRSLDEFLESAYASRPRSGSVLVEVCKLSRFYIVFFALGLANSGDSAEMGCTNYSESFWSVVLLYSIIFSNSLLFYSVLSSETFQRDILANGEDVDFASKGAAIASAHFLGMLFSGLISGVLADIYGRRATLLFGLCANSIFGLCAAASRNAVELAILRFGTGLAVGAVIAGVVTLSAEMAPPSRRGRFMTLVASCYTLGFLYTAAWAVVIFRGDDASGSWR